MNDPNIFECWSNLARSPPHTIVQYRYYEFCSFIAGEEGDYIDSNIQTLAPLLPRNKQLLWDMLDGNTEVKDTILFYSCCYMHHLSENYYIDYITLRAWIPDVGIFRNLLTPTYG